MACKWGTLTRKGWGTPLERLHSDQDMNITWNEFSLKQLSFLFYHPSSKNNEAPYLRKGDKTVEDCDSQSNANWELSYAHMHV